ncbi:MAG: hypothetical protein ACSHWU_07165 [Marinicella sp.]
MSFFKAIQFVICLIASSQLSANETDQTVPKVGSIEAVAGQYMNVLLQTNDWYVFRIDLPAQAVLADHKTGPRVIILLTDLSGKRLADDSMITAEAKQAFYLENTLSKGFQNVAQSTASYLVLPIPDSLPMQEFIDCQEQGLKSILENAPILVCENSFDIEFISARAVLWYKQGLSQAEVIAANVKQAISAGDLIIQAPGHVSIDD